MNRGRASHHVLSLLSCLATALLLLAPVQVGSPNLLMIILFFFVQNCSVMSSQWNSSPLHCHAVSLTLVPNLVAWCTLQVQNLER
jgi:hypothetical protein